MNDWRLSQEKHCDFSYLFSNKFHKCFYGFRGDTIASKCHVFIFCKKQTKYFKTDENLKMARINSQDLFLCHPIPLCVVQSWATSQNLIRLKLLSRQKLISKAKHLFQCQTFKGNIRFLPSGILNCWFREKQYYASVFRLEGTAQQFWIFGGVNSQT
jgi:hypothetical protein